jgi:hypothetical protein
VVSICVSAVAYFTKTQARSRAQESQAQR